MRNEYGYGSIICLDKSGKKRRKPWAVRITTGWKNGKQVRKYLGYYKTQKEALIALAEYHKNEVNFDLNDLTLKEVWERWFEGVESKGLSYSTIANHKIAYKTLDRLLDVKIKEIKAAHLQKWMDSLDMKPSSKNKMKSSVKQVFDYALQNDIIRKNYVTFVEVKGKIEKVGEIFTDDEIKMLWDRVDTDEAARQLLILMYTGMRIGEMLALNKENIHLDKGYMIGGSKTEAGRDRVIPIHDRILPLVKEQLGNNNWLVQSSRNLPKSYSNASLKYRELFKTLGFNHRIHDTRKTAVSLMHSAGIPMETIKIIVGHSGDNVTEKVYLYKQPEELVRAINTLEIPY